MKCPKCGYWDPYWLKMNWDKECEYAKPDDVADLELTKLKPRELMAKDGYVYYRTPKYLTRTPIEIFRARGGRFNTSKGYWDATNFDHKHWRSSNERLERFS